MLIERKHSNLIITDFSEEEDLQTLKQCCSVRYREKSSQGRYYMRDINYYQLVDENTFLTSMAFLHGIKENFPDAEINIQEREKLPIVFKKNFKLWEQEQETLLLKWLNNGKRGTIVLPTAGGKSFIGMASIFYLRLPTLIVVPKKEIQRKVWQRNLIEKLGIPPNHIGYFDGEFKQIKPFTITIYNSGYLYIDKLKDKFEFLIMDECHHAPAHAFKEISLKSDAFLRLGLTATIERQDHNEELVYKSIGNIIKGPDFQELVKEKRIAPFEHEKIFIEMLSDEKRKYQEYMGKFYYSPKKEKMKWKTKAEQIALGSLAKIPKVTYLVFKHQKEKILVFTKFIRQAKLLKQVLTPFNAQLLLGETKKEERNKIFDWFHKSNHAVIISSSCLDEGIDIPDARIAVIMSGFGTKRQMIQRIGRTVRYQPGKISKIYEIVSKGTMDESQSKRRQIIS